MLSLRRNNRRGNRRSATEERRWQLPALPWQALAISSATALGIAAVGLGLLWFVNQPIERIQVDGSFQHLTALDVEKAVRAQLHGAGLISVRINAVQRGIRALPWVESASVQRSWPHGLAVRVSEQQALARWNGRDLVNAEGTRFASDARFVAPELPQLAGPSGSEAAVVARYLALQGRITEAGMRLVALRLDARGAWEAQLDNGIIVRFGRKQIEERSARFVAVVLRMLVQRAADIAYVDLRYTNGFAIGWRSGATRLAGNTLKEDGTPHG
jgi:cell division protein FtsQ